MVVLLIKTMKVNVIVGLGEVGVMLMMMEVENPLVIAVMMILKVEEGLLVIGEVMT